MKLFEYFYVYTLIKYYETLNTPTNIKKRALNEG